MGEVNNNDDYEALYDEYEKDRKLHKYRKFKYEIINFFQKNLITKLLSDNVIQCSICLENCKETLVYFACGHILHQYCYNKLKEDLCPLCRSNLVIIFET